MALGYQLPGVTLTEVNNTATPNPSSSQRIPCFIGKASATKKVVEEEITRTSTGSIDQLTNYSTGIASVISAGTQKGLTDLTSGVDFNVNQTTGQVTWVVESENKTIAADTKGEELFSSLTNFITFNATSNGVDATPGYQEVGLQVASSSASGLSYGVPYYFTVNSLEYSITMSSTGGITYSDVVAAMASALILSPVTPTFVTSDIRLTNKTSGAGNDVTLAAGSSGTDLFASLTGWTTFDVAVPGANATSGYQTCGLNRLTTDLSGLAASTRYYFRVSGVEYSILTASALTIADIIALMNTALTGTNYTCTYSSGDIKFTNTTTGSSSTVVLAYGTAKAAVNGQLTVKLSGGVIFARKPGEVTASVTHGASTYVFGIADDIAIGDLYVTLSGTESQLNAIDVNDAIVLTKVPKVIGGGRYYITYTYNRATSDYKYKEFTKWEDVIADLGDDLPENPLVNILNLAFNYYGNPKVAVVQVPPTNQNSDYVAALQKCKHRDIQTPLCLNSSATVRNAVIAHINERSTPENARYRMSYFGAPALTPVGDATDTNSICGISYLIKNQKAIFINATRAKYYYKDATGTDTYYVVDGAFIAAAIGSYRDSFVYPAQNLIRQTIPGLELFAEDFDDYYSDEVLKQAGACSVFLVRLGANNSIFVADDMTTDNTSVERNNINIITAKHYIVRDVAIQVDRTFTGKLILNRSEYQKNIEQFLIRLFGAYKSNKIIEDIAEITVSLPATRKDTVHIKYAYFAVYTHKYTEGEYTIAI